MQLALISASALHPCGKTRALKRLHPPDTARLARMRQGVEFHELAAMFFRGVPLPDWVENPVWGKHTMAKKVNLLLEKLAPSVPAENRCIEMALGLSDTGEYVKVYETEPDSHDYRTCDGETEQAVTAGRLDLAWHQGGLGTVIDYKGYTSVGRPEQVFQLQMLCLAYGKMVGVKSVRPGIYYAANGYLHWGEEIAIPNDELTAQVVDMAFVDDEDPRPAAYCKTCWQVKKCDDGNRAEWAHG